MEKFEKHCASHGKPELKELLQEQRKDPSGVTVYVVSADGRCSRRLEDEDARVLVDGVMLSGLQIGAVSLPNHSFGDMGAADLSRLLKLGGDDGEDMTLKTLSHYHPVVVELNLRGNSIGKNGAAAIAAEMTAESTLETLDLSWNPLGKEGGYRIAEVIGRCADLRTVSVAQASLDLPALVAILSVLRTTDAHLESLDVSGACLKAEHQEDLASHLSSMLRANATLLHLRLDACRLTDDGISVVAPALTRNRTLRTLSLRANRLRAAGAAALADTLIARASKGWPLVALDICACQVGDEGARYLAEALTRDARLQTLDVCRNNIGDEGLAAIADALINNNSKNNGRTLGEPRLALLRAWGNHFGPEANRRFHDLINGQDAPPANKKVPMVALDFKTYVVDGKVTAAEKVPDQ